MATIPALPMSAQSSQQKSAKCQTIQSRVGIGAKFASEAIAMLALPYLFSLILTGIGKNQSNGLQAGFLVLKNTSIGNI